MSTAELARSMERADCLLGEHAYGAACACNKEAAGVLSLPGGLAGAFMTALPVGQTTMNNDMFAVAAWCRVGIRDPTVMPSGLCQCSAVVTATAEVVVVVVKVSRICQDTQIAAARLVVSHT